MIQKAIQAAIQMQLLTPPMKNCTKNIDQPVHPKDHPSFHLTNKPANHRQCDWRTRNSEPTPDSSPEGEQHQRGVQLRAHFLEDFWVGKPDEQGRRYATGHQLR